MRDLPLSHEEGRCLGVDEVISLHKIQHECSAARSMSDMNIIRPLIQTKLTEAQLTDSPDVSLLQTAKRLLAQQDPVSLATGFIRHRCTHGCVQVLPIYSPPVLTIRSCEKFTSPWSSPSPTILEREHCKGGGPLHFTCAFGKVILQANGNNVRHRYPAHTRF
jgi:hypothetical protein